LGIFHGVTKLKPTATPRIFDTRAGECQEKAKRTVHESQVAVLRSKQLLKKSHEVLETIKSRRTGT